MGTKEVLLSSEIKNQALLEDFPGEDVEDLKVETLPNSELLKIEMKVSGGGVSAVNSEAALRSLLTGKGGAFWEDSWLARNYSKIGSLSVSNCLLPEIKKELEKITKVSAENGYFVKPLSKKDIHWHQDPLNHDESFSERTVTLYTPEVKVGDIARPSPTEIIAARLLRKNAFPIFLAYFQSNSEHLYTNENWRLSDTTSIFHLDYDPVESGDLRVTSGSRERILAVQREAEELGLVKGSREYNFYVFLYTIEDLDQVLGNSEDLAQQVDNLVGGSLVKERHGTHTLKIINNQNVFHRQGIVDNSMYSSNKSFTPVLKMNIADIRSVYGWTRANNENS